MPDKLTPQDISSIPPLDATGEMKDAARLLARWRKQLDDSGLSNEWKSWIVQSLLKGLLAGLEQKP